MDRPILNIVGSLYRIAGVIAAVVLAVGGFVRSGGIVAGIVGAMVGLIIGAGIYGFGESIAAIIAIEEKVGETDRRLRRLEEGLQKQWKSVA